MNNTLKYGFQVLEYLADAGNERGTTKIAKALGLAKSQTSRVLSTLSEIGYVTQNKETRKYEINLSILKLSHNCLANMRQRHVIRPYMQQLVDKWDQACYSSVPIGLEAIVCDVIYPRDLANSANIIAQIGAVNDPYTTGSGKLCAAYLPDNERKILFSVKKPIQYTSHSLTDKKAIKEEYKKIKNYKLAVSRSERSEGANSLAAPIFDNSKNFIATIGITLPHGQLSDDIWREYKNAIIELANAASFALGYPLN